MSERARISLLGAWVDPVNRREAIARILTWCESKAQRYVVTPNLDHCRQLQTNAALQYAYAQAGLVVPDGWPLLLASRFTTTKLQERVTGSDLILPLCEAAVTHHYSIYLLGSLPENLAAARTVLTAQFPNLRIVGCDSPPFGFERDARQVAAVNERIREAAPHLLFVALGAPKQECWMAEHVPTLPIGAAIGVGAGLDFIAGAARRAPLFIRRIGLEWAWRVGQEPKRLFARYAACIAALPILFVQHIKRQQQANPKHWDRYLADLESQAPQALAYRHEIYFLHAKSFGKRARAMIALLRDLWVLLRLPRTHLLAPDVSCCAIATLDGASGMGAIVRARRRFGNERTMPLLVHPRLRQAYPQAGLPAPITLREIGTALWQSRKYVAQKGALSRLIVAACSVRHTLWQASWRRFFSGNPRVTQFLLHNDFEMATSALVSCADSRETICVQHGIPTDEFFPARATTQIVWGETSRSVYMRYAPKVHCAIDALGRGAQPQAPLPVAPVGIALLSQTHTPIYGMDLAPWFESLAYDLAQHKDAAPFHILLHPRESAACYYRGLGPSLKRGAQALLSATAPRQLVVGYCSTGLIEAALAGHYVVAMDWPMPASKGAREVCNPTTLCSNAREVLALFHALQENAGLRTEILAKQQAWLAETFVDPDEVKHVA